MTLKEKNKVKEIVHGITIDKLTKLVEDTANDKFIDMVINKIKKDLKYDVRKKEEEELVSDLCYEVIRPLHIKLLEFTVGKDLPKNLTKSI